MFKPLEAAKLDSVSELLALDGWPYMVSLKLDGVRVLVTPDKGVVSRKLEQIPNDLIREKLAKYVGLDGEIIVRDSEGKANYDLTSAFVRTKDAVGEFEYHVFDWFTSDVSFNTRWDLFTHANQSGLFPEPFIIPAFQTYMGSPEIALDAYMRAIENGHEGIMLRSPSGRYKHGRATLKSRELIKLKPKPSTEAVVVGFEEQMTNTNKKQTNNLGRTKRSTHKENLIPNGTLGALKMQLPNGPVFNVGTGFTAEQRKTLWRNREQLIGKIVEFEYQEILASGKPRFPVFVRFRDEFDYFGPDLGSTEG